MADLSVADALALGSNRNYDDDGMFGGNGAWWIIILFLFMFANGGWGGFGNNGLNQVTNDFLFTNLKSTIDSGFTQLANQGFSTQRDILQGFDRTNSTVQCVGNGIQRDLCQGFNGVNSNIAQLGYNMQDCCCETNRNIDAVRYENAKNTCDIITAQNANTQKILDKMCENEINTLRTDLQSAQLQISQLAQTSNIVNTLRPTPIPAYITCSPYQAANYGYGAFGCGYNSGCGCCGV